MRLLKRRIRINIFLFCLFASSFLQPTASWLPDGSLRDNHQKLVQPGDDTKLTKDYYGQAIALHEGRILVGAYAERSSAKRGGAAYLYSASEETPVSTFRPDDPNENDYFGSAVALDGDTLIVAACAFPTTGGRGRNAVFVFQQQQAGEWKQIQQLTSSDSDQTTTFFGLTVALWDDTLAIAAIDEEEEQPIVFVYTRSGTVWEQTQQLVLPATWENPTLPDKQISLALHNNILVVGVPGEASQGPNTGMAFVYMRSQDMWMLETTLVDPQGETLDHFGCSVAVWDDVVLVGAWGKDLEDFVSNTQEGAAYIFTDDDGSGWAVQAQLMAETAVLRANMGQVVQLHQNVAVLGAQDSVHVFVQGPDGIWEEERELKAPATGESFGTAGLALEGSNLAIGAPLHSRGNPVRKAGAVYVYIDNERGEPVEDEPTVAPTTAVPQTLTPTTMAPVPTSSPVAPSTPSPAPTTAVLQTTTPTTVAPAPTSSPVAPSTRSPAPTTAVLQTTTPTTLAPVPTSSPVAPSTRPPLIQAYQFLQPMGIFKNHFGRTLAQAGNFAIFGAPEKGAAYIYRRDVMFNQWFYESTVILEATSFGSAVAMLDDETAVVGSYASTLNVDGSGSNQVGFMAHLYEWDWGQAQWVQIQTLMLAVGASTLAELSPSSMAMDTWKDTHLAVGELGVVGIFEKANGVWTEEAIFKLPVPNGQETSYPMAVALHKDTLVCSIADGSVYVYTRQSNDNTWKQTVLVPAEEGADGSADQFGISLAVFDDTILVGANRHNSRAGAVYVYRLREATRSVFVRQTARSVTLEWKQTDVLTAANPSSGAEFGAAVALEEGLAVIGAPNDDAVFIFPRNASGDIDKDNQIQIASPSTEGSSQFGLSINLDNGDLLVGAHLHRRGLPDTEQVEAGTVFLYSLQGYGDLSLMQPGTDAPTLAPSVEASAIPTSVVPHNNNNTRDVTSEGRDKELASEPTRPPRNQTVKEGAETNSSSSLAPSSVSPTRSPSTFPSTTPPTSFASSYPSASPTDAPISTQLTSSPTVTSKGSINQPSQSPSNVPTTTPSPSLGLQESSFPPLTNSTNPNSTTTSTLPNTTLVTLKKNETSSSSSSSSSQNPRTFADIASDDDDAVTSAARTPCIYALRVWTVLLGVVVWTAGSWT